MTHLDPDSWRALQRGQLPPEALAHLSEACEQCDAFVAGLDDTPALDRAVDAALGRLSERVSPADALSLRRAERRVLAAVRPRARPWWLVSAVPIAVAAGLALFVARPLLSTGPEQRLKGPAAPPGLSARVMPARGAALEPFVPTRPYPQTAELFFTYTLGSDAHVYLGRLGIDGSVEAFYPPIGAADEPHPAGRWALTAGGVVQGYSLGGLSGRQRFVIVASPRPLAGDALTQALVEAARAQPLEIEVAGP